MSTREERGGEGERGQRSGKRERMEEGRIDEEEEGRRKNGMEGKERKRKK